MMVSADYKDAVETFYAVNCRELAATIQKLKYENTPIKFVDWTKNSVCYYVRGVYGVTYG